MKNRNIITAILTAALFAVIGCTLNAQTDKYEFKRTNAAGTAWTAPQTPTLTNALLATDATGAPAFTPQSNFASATALASATTSLAALVASSTFPNAATLLEITESGGLPLWSGSAWPGGGGGGGNPFFVSGTNGAIPTAAGGSSVAIGPNANSTGNYGIAIGDGSIAGNSGVAIGNSAGALSIDYSVSIGGSAKAATNCTSVGWSSVAGGSYSVAIGYKASSFFPDSVAIGCNTSVTETGVVSIGNRRLTQVSAGTGADNVVTLGQITAPAPTNVTATGTTQGVIMVGSGLAITSGTLSVAGSANYSSSEHAVGTWIDGRTIYEKTLTGFGPQLYGMASGMYIPVSASGTITKIISLQGVIERTKHGTSAMTHIGSTDPLPIVDGLTNLILEMRYQPLSEADGVTPQVIQLITGQGNDWSASPVTITIRYLLQ